MCSSNYFTYSEICNVQEVQLLNGRRNVPATNDAFFFFFAAVVCHKLTSGRTKERLVSLFVTSSSSSAPLYLILPHLHHSLRSLSRSAFLPLSLCPWFSSSALTAPLADSSPLSPPASLPACLSSLHFFDCRWSGEVKSVTQKWRVDNPAY